MVDVSLREWAALPVIGALLAGGVLCPSARGVEPPEPLDLRVNDAEVRPGEPVVLVVRTYAPRPISQGQLLLRSSSGETSAQGLELATGLGPGKLGSASSPFAEITGVEIVSREGDDVEVLSSSVLEGGQALAFEFQSVLSTVNETDGPLAVIRLALATDVTSGQVFTIGPVPAESSFLDADGNVVEIRSNPGQLTILDPTAPMELQMDEVEVMSGTTAVVEVSTVESRALSGATIVVDFDSAVLAGPSSVAPGPLQGAVVTVQEEVLSDPDRTRLTIDLTATAAGLNQVPGPLVEISVPTVSGLGTGASSPVVFDAAATELRADGGGDLIALALENGSLHFVTDVIFCSGFEDGDLTGWN